MLMMLRVLAAGSLRPVWPELMAAFSAQSGIATETRFGPAGLLRQRIEQGEPCDLFASASQQHTEALVQQQRASESALFAANRLCLTARASVVAPGDSWLTLLQRPALRLATSTPLSDPSGDYTWQMFAALERHYPGLGKSLRQRALKLVGGADTVALPSGALAAHWLLTHDFADLFIGYASYAPRLATFTTLKVYDIPALFNILAHYSYAICQPSALPLGDFLRSETAQMLLQQQGFLLPVPQS